ncbi:MAG: hypothetical protein RUDDFDWM_001555 [Candidatus Fervidibacterota bacterium]
MRVLIKTGVRAVTIYRKLGLLIFVLIALIQQSLESASIIIDDFEGEVADWECRDSTQLDRANLCAIWLVSPGCPQSKGRKAALITFFSAKDSWASVSKSVDGRKLVGAEGISFWFRGDGSNTSVTLSLTVKGRAGEKIRFDFKLPLGFLRWQWIAIPFNEFHSPLGNLTLAGVENITAIEFRMDGTWDSAFVLVDDIQTYGGHELKPTIVEQKKGVEPSPTGAKLVNIFVEPEVVIGKVRARVGTNIDRAALRLIGNIQAIERVRQLQLGMSRIRTTDALMWSEERQGKELNHQLITQLINLARELRTHPMIAAIPMTQQHFENSEFALQVTDIVKRYSSEVVTIEIGYCHASALSTSTQRVVELIARVSDTAVKVRPKCAIGGVGLLAPWHELVTSFLRLPRPFDFFSVHFFGTHNASTTTEALMDAAVKGVAADLPNQVSLNLLSALVRQRWGNTTGLYITEANLNSIRTDGGRARDERISLPEGMAWWMAFLHTLSTSVDEVLQFKLCGDGWGLIDDDLQPTPAYWAVWMFNIFSPRGASICKLTVDGSGISCIAVRTATSLNVLFANLDSTLKQVEVRVSNRFAPQITMVRLRRVMPTGKSVSQPTYEVFSPETRITTLLPGYGIGVLQFVTARR